MIPQCPRPLLRLVLALKKLLRCPLTKNRKAQDASTSSVPAVDGLDGLAAQQVQCRRRSSGSNYADAADLDPVRSSGKDLQENQQPGENGGASGDSIHQGNVEIWSNKGVFGFSLAMVIILQTSVAHPLLSSGSKDSSLGCLRYG